MTFGKTSQREIHSESNFWARCVQNATIQPSAVSENGVRALIANFFVTSPSEIALGGSHRYTLREMAINPYKFARACHQAGHVVMAHALSLKVVAISLDPDLTYAARMEDEVQGLVNRKFPADLDRFHRRIEKKSMTILAGPVAQRLLATSAYRHFGAAKDRQLALRFLQTISNTIRQVAAHSQYLDVSVQELLAPNLADVREVASALASSGALTARDVLAIRRG